MSGHTPGPWAAEGFDQIAGRGDFYGGIVVGGDDIVVAQCIAPRDAPLIAGAPATFAELVRLIAAVDAQMSQDWGCTSYHPGLHSALESARAIVKREST